MKKIISIIGCLFIITKSYTQNLIPNHSFEDTLVTAFWTTNMGICFNSPMNICSNQKVKTTNVEQIHFDVIDSNHCAYLSLFQCHTGWSDYLINKGFKLEKGKQYEFSFYITPSDSCGYYSKQIDILFCNIADLSNNLSCSTPGKIFLPPSMSFDIASFKQTGQEGKWTKLSYVFVAKGTENTLIVGRFFSNKKVRKIVSTRTLSYKPTKQFFVENFCSADYYLDNFSLVEK
jgi:hypothetical protein